MQSISFSFLFADFETDEIRYKIASNWAKEEEEEKKMENYRFQLNFQHCERLYTRGIIANRSKSINRYFAIAQDLCHVKLDTCEISPITFNHEKFKLKCV